MAGKVQPLLCSGHTRPVTHLQFSNQLEDDSFYLISACKDGNPMLRNCLGDWIGSFLGHKGAVWSSKISLDTSRAATGSADFSAKIWDTYSGEALHTFSHSHIVRSVALSPQASPQYLLTGGHEKKIRLFDLGRPDAEPLILGSHSSLADVPTGQSCKGNIKSLVWDEGQGGVVGISAGEDGLVRWWDLRTLTQTSSFDMGEPISSMEMVHGGGTLSVTSGKTVHFLDILGQHPPVSIALPHPVSSASLHPLSRDRFVVGSTADPWVRVYDLDTGKEREVYKGHHGPVHTVAYSPDGEMYASGSEDGTIRLWQTTPGTNYGLWQGAAGAPTGLTSNGHGAGAEQMYMSAGMNGSGNGNGQYNGNAGGGGGYSNGYSNGSSMDAAKANYQGSGMYQSNGGGYGAY